VSVCIEPHPRSQRVHISRMTPNLLRLFWIVHQYNLKISRSPWQFIQNFETFWNYHFLRYVILVIFGSDNNIIDVLLPRINFIITTECYFSFSQICRINRRISSLCFWFISSLRIIIIIYFMISILLVKTLFQNRSSTISVCLIIIGSIIIVISGLIILVTFFIFI